MSVSRLINPLSSTTAFTVLMGSPRIAFGTMKIMMQLTALYTGSSASRQTDSSCAVMQKASMQTERTLSIPLVDLRGHGGMATMDPAGSAVLDHLFGADASHI